LQCRITADLPLRAPWRRPSRSSDKDTSAARAGGAARHPWAVSNGCSRSRKAAGPGVRAATGARSRAPGRSRRSVGTAGDDDHRPRRTPPRPTAPRNFLKRAAPPLRCTGVREEGAVEEGAVIGQDAVRGYAREGARRTLSCRRWSPRTVSRGAAAVLLPLSRPEHGPGRHGSRRSLERVLFRVGARSPSRTPCTRRRSGSASATWCCTARRRNGCGACWAASPASERLLAGCGVCPDARLSRLAGHTTDVDDRARQLCVTSTNSVRTVLPWCSSIATTPASVPSIPLQ